MFLFTLLAPCITVPYSLCHSVQLRSSRFQSALWLPGLLEYECVWSFVVRKFLGHEYVCGEHFYYFTLMLLHLLWAFLRRKGTTDSDARLTHRCKGVRERARRLSVTRTLMETIKRTAKSYGFMYHS